MHSSDALPSDDPREVLRATFDVPAEVLAGLRFVDAPEEIWVTSSPPLVGLRARRPQGLRAFRRGPNGLKPTSAFLTAIGQHIRSSRAAVSIEQLRLLLLGQRIPWSGEDGHVAIALGTDILGCGRVSHARLQALIPSGRRSELLSILRTHPAEM